MNTKYYGAYPDQTSHVLLGERGFGMFEGRGPRPIFRWAVNPAEYLWNTGAHLVVDESGQIVMARSDFALLIVGKCEVQVYDQENLPR